MSPNETRLRQKLKDKIWTNLDGEELHISDLHERDLEYWIDAIGNGPDELGFSFLRSWNEMQHWLWILEEELERRSSNEQSN